MQSIPAVLAVFFAGSAVLTAAFCWWRPGFPRRAALGYVALTAAFFAAPLFTGRLQVATDLAYVRLPFQEMADEEGKPHNFFQADTLLEQLPFHVLVRQRLLAGEAPLWAHELGTGQPLLGNGQSAPFAPLHVLALPLAPARGLTVAGAWQILLGLLTTHALLLWLGAGRWGAALGAVSAGLSTYAVAWIYDTPGMAAAYVPGLLLGLLLVRAGEPRGWTGLTACALGLALSGHPETMAHAGLVAALVVIFLLCERRPGRWHFLGRLAAAALLAAALAAPALLPLVETIPQSVHGNALARKRENFQPPPFEARYLLPTLAPLAWGSPPDGDYSLERSYNEMCTEYAGLLVLALAVAGALAVRGRPLLLVLGGLAALLIALRVSPLFDLMLRLPVIGPGAHGRLREFWVLAVALAAGLVLDRVALEKGLRLVTTALIAAAGLGLGFSPPPGSAPWPRAWWIATLAGAVAALFALLVPRLRPAFAPLVVAAVALDLFLLGVRYHPPVPARLDLSPPPVVTYLAQQSRAAAAPFRVSFEDYDLAPNLNALYGLWDPRGYDPMRPEDAARMVGWWLGRSRNFYQMTGDSLPVLDQAAHDYLAVRFMTTSHERGLPPPWRLTYEGKGGRVWENPQALPLFFMPRSVERVAELADAQRAAKHGADFRAAAWIAGGTTGAPAVQAQDGQVRAIHPRSNGFDLEVQTATGGVVASSVSYLAGWQARLGDRAGALEVVEVNGGFLGLRVPPGAHSIRLRYRPLTWPLGLALCAGGVVACLLAGWGRWRSWNRSETLQAAGQRSRNTNPVASA